MRTEKNVNTRQDFLKYIKSYLPSNPVCVEIGVHLGYFSEMILNELSPSKLHLIDPWEVGSDKNSEHKTYPNWDSLTTAYSHAHEMRKVKEKFSTYIDNGVVEIHRGFSYDVVGLFKNNYFDFVYIDATHIYECVKADVNMFLPKMKSDGLMCGHDYFNDSKGAFSVVKAVDEFVDNDTLEWVALSGGNDWALKQKNTKRGFFQKLKDSLK
jgi:hypothetical protein